MGWSFEVGYEIPQLEDDAEAVKRAKKYFELDPEGFVLSRNDVPAFSLTQTTRPHTKAHTMPPSNFEEFVNGAG